MNCENVIWIDEGGSARCKVPIVIIKCDDKDLLNYVNNAPTHESTLSERNRETVQRQVNNDL